MNRTHARVHHRVGEKNSKQQSEEKSLMEFDIKKTTLIVAIFCFIQGWLIGLAMKRR
ncbi:MAG: hypothetical protein N4A63_17595 [Vallitalea sp.]|nr:hypothetical protein [Vallitalea sp.]